MGDHAMRMGARRSFASRSHRRDHWKAALAALVLIGIAPTVVGCGDGERTGSPVNTAAQGVMVSVDKGETTVGFSRGLARVAEKTVAFKISKSPITRKQYQACEAAKICKAPKIEECSDPVLAKASFKGVDDSAAVCVGRENAQAYCSWVGGRLPTLAEWLRAARGPSVQEYPWGSNRASCAQHPRSVEGSPRFRQNAGQSISTDGCDASPERAIVTKMHPTGAATKSGMQDILITPAELLVGHDNSPFAVCTKGQHCLVYGLNAGSIDSVKAYTIASAIAGNPGEEPRMRFTPEAYGFRCVVEK